MLDVINIVRGPNGIHCQVVLRVCFQDLHFKKLKLMFVFPFFYLTKVAKLGFLPLPPPPPPPNCVSNVYKNLENSPQFIANHVPNENQRNKNFNKI
jgi:hypothetical protein